MKSREAKRFDGNLLLEDLTNVLLVFQDKQQFGAKVVDISSQGIRVSIPPTDITLHVPQNNETVVIIFTIIQLQITCRCIYSMNDQNDSMLMGFYIFDPDDQSKLRKILDSID